jgi:hypothetical protein
MLYHILSHFLYGYYSSFHIKIKTTWFQPHNDSPFSGLNKLKPPKICPIGKAVNSSVQQNLPTGHIDTPRLMQELHSGGSAICRNFANFGIECSLYVANCVRTYELFQFKSKLQHNGTWSATAWLPRRLCYRPAVVFHYLLLIVLPVAQWTIWRTFQ